MIGSNESITVCWPDNGMVDGNFALSLVTAVVHLKENFEIHLARSKGNQIARQRNELFLKWEEQKTDWLLWIDSDVVFTLDSLNILLQYAHKDIAKVISGVYFIPNLDGLAPLATPTPAIFNNSELNFPKSIHPLPINKLIEIDYAGFGFLLMHKSIIDNIKTVAGNESVFAETLESDKFFIGEDIKFFTNLKKAGIQAYAHTGALAQHMKIFSIDINYYNAFWGTKLNQDG